MAEVKPKVPKVYPDDVRDNIHSRPAKYDSQCCALAQITCKNDTPVSQIQAIIDKARGEVTKNFRGEGYGAGYRAFYIICTVGEAQLERKIRSIGFKLVKSFARRNGLPAGRNKMFMINF